MPPDFQSPLPQEAPLSSLQQRLPTLAGLLNLFSGKSAREGYLAAVDQGVISLSNFVATILLARSISPTELGIYGVGFTALRLTRCLQEGLVVQPMNVIGAGMDEGLSNATPPASSLIQIVAWQLPPP
jgi:hypothetical protein